jgi:GNAT superfamily N-acetyltransferase
MIGLVSRFAIVQNPHIMSEPRAIQPDELPLLGELLNDVFRRSQGVADQDVFCDFPLAFAPENLPNGRVIAEAGRPVSHAAVWPRELIVEGWRLKLGVITLVATQPEFRRRGLAARLMTNLQQRMRDEGYDLGVLWTGVPDFYRRLGWQVFQPLGGLVRDVRSVPKLAEFTSTDSAAERIETFNPQRHLTAISELHDREPIRFARSPADSAALLSLPKMDVRVLIRQDQVAAYLVTGQACNKRGLIEYGGAAADIGLLMADVVRCPQITGPLPLVIHHTHPELAQFVTDLGQPPEPLPCSKGLGCEMLLVLRPERVSPTCLTRAFVWGLDTT